MIMAVLQWNKVTIFGFSVKRFTDHYICFFSTLYDMFYTGMKQLTNLSFTELKAREQFTVFIGIYGSDISYSIGWKKQFFWKYKGIILFNDEFEKAELLTLFLLFISSVKTFITISSVKVHHIQIKAWN